MQTLDIMLIGVYTFMLYSSILWLVVFFKHKNKIFTTHSSKINFPSVTFLIPTYNEEKNIRKCIEKIFSLNYPKNKINVIVIDDGSTDKTSEIVKQCQKKYPNLKLLKQKHKGKAAALNFGLKHVKTELVISMDADSFPEKNYLVKTVGIFAKDKKIAAVTPAIKITKTDTWIRKIQWLEYIYQLFLRKLFSIFGCEYVIPGPGGIYRTALLKKIGGWDENSLTEDMEVTFRMREKGYKIFNVPTAYTYTEAPKDFWGLWKQRIRWYRGYLENVRKYAHMIGNPQYGNWGIFFLPANFLWIFTLGFLFFSFLYEVSIKLLNSLIAWQCMKYLIILPKFELSILYLSSFTFFHLVFLTLGLLSIWLSITIAKEKLNLKELDRCLLFLFVYPILLTLWWIAALLLEISKRKKKW